MKKLAGFWIRKNKNVQVRVGENSKEKAVVFFRNGHVRYIERKQFLDEFISLDDLLAEITKDSRWIALGSGHKICVTDIRVRSGIVFYHIEGVPKEYSHGGVDIQKFKGLFKRDLSEVAK